MTPRWREIGHRVFVRRHPGLDVNVGLVVGEGACLVVDTLGTASDAADLIASIRAVTTTPWTVVNTHAHFDHCFGNTAFRPAEIWAHEGAVEHLRRHGEDERRSARRYLPGRAAELPAVRIDPPDRTVREQAELNLGGRVVRLVHPGRGHTDHDLIVLVPDAHVVFAGDLVEQGAPPDFEDAFPAEWPRTLDAVAALAAGPVVPGHGDVVDGAFVRAQAADLRLLAEHLYGSQDHTDLPFPAGAIEVARGRPGRADGGDTPAHPHGDTLG